MKTFRWVKTRTPYSDTERHTLIETNVDGKEEIVRFWAILHNCPRNLFQPYLFKPDRSGYETILDELELEEAKLQVEKRLMDTGVMSEGDEVIIF